MPRYVLPPDLPGDVREFTAVMLPVSWGIIRNLRSGPPLTLDELRQRLLADPRTITKRLDALEAAGVVHVLPEGIQAHERQGRVLHYRLDIARFNELHLAWMVYVQAALPPTNTEA